jgi:MarR family 2-MHQ and catechol resistance regulon transcriptional repressor
MGTRHKGSIKEIIALDTYIKLLRASDTLSSIVNNSISKSGLTSSQFNVLDALLHLGPLTQKDLSSKLLKSGGNITMIVDNLEKLQFVVRKRGVKDRRYFTVQLTKRGRNKISTIYPKQVKLIEDSMNTLTEKEQYELQMLCKKLGLNVKLPAS